MNKKIRILPALLLSAILLTGAGCGTGSARKPAVAELDLNAKYTARGVKLFSFICPDPSYTTAQGCCFDGENWVVAFNRFDMWGEECTLLCKFDRKGNFVKSSDGPLYLEHANNITYIPEQKAYYVTSCQGTISECWNGYTLVDRDTLEVKKKGRLDAPFFAMSYCPEKKAFASGRWAGETLDFWDNALNLTGTRDVTPPGTLSQGMFAAPDAVWFVRSSMNGLHQELRLYDWSGELINQILLDLENDAESESVNIVDGVLYVTSNGGNQAPLYRVDFRVN